LFNNDDVFLTGGAVINEKLKKGGKLERMKMLMYP